MQKKIKEQQLATLRTLYVKKEISVTVLVFRCWPLSRVPCRSSRQRDD